MPLKSAPANLAHFNDGAALPALPTNQSPAETLARPSVVVLGQLFIIMVVWLIGAVLGLTAYLVSRSRFLEEIGPRNPVVEDSMLTELEFLKEASGYEEQVQLTESSRLRSAVVIGRNEICVPTRIWTELSDCEQRSMLAHEFAHVLRRDPLWLQLFNLLCGVLFMQPLNFIARKQYRAIAEYSCDTWVMRTTGLGSSLASCLVKVAQWIRGGYNPSPFMGIGGSPLRQRIERILDGVDDKPSPWLFGCGLATILAVGAFTPAIIIHDSADEPVSGNIIAEYTPLPSSHYDIRQSSDTVRVIVHPSHRYEFVFENQPNVVATGMGTILIDRSSPQILAISAGGFVRFDQQRDGEKLQSVTFENDGSGNVRATYGENRMRQGKKVGADKWLASAMVLFANAAEANDNGSAQALAFARQLEERNLVGSLRPRSNGASTLNYRDAVRIDSMQTAERALVNSERLRDQQYARRNVLSRQVESLHDQLEAYENRLETSQNMTTEELQKKIEAIKRLATQSLTEHQHNGEEYLAAVEQFRLQAQEKEDAMRLEALESTASAVARLQNSASISGDMLVVEMQEIEAATRRSAQEKYADDIAAIRSKLAIANQQSEAHQNSITDAATEYSKAVRLLESQLAQMRLETVGGIKTSRLRDQEALEDKIASLKNSIEVLTAQLAELNGRLR